MKKFIFILLLLLPNLLFSQLFKETDSTYILRLTQKEVDKFFEKMSEFEKNKQLLEIEKENNKIYENIISLKDSIIKNDSLIILNLNQKYSLLQETLNNDTKEKLKFWQGLYVGIGTETYEKTDWQKVNIKSFRYVIKAEANFKISNILLRGGINLHLTNEKPTYYIQALYRIF